ncbi:acyl-CoA dehydrogenase [Rhodovulum sp. 12E13]|uniref:acyl-CoA dehydrogenase n=1 Tax=Rhodovulum sp. 12E13 TaxID=2203891 RepID=UPI000E1848A4|nr:acyl-CoA dehydrogenase [Rhodovulum sp. 12E13]RDC74930.1 acyl-CoA dehydrogenase [Rhodovulum sp. 12E13]
MPYTPPLDELRFLLRDVVGFGRVQATGRFAEATDDVAAAALAEAGRLCAEVLEPLRRVGDTQPARLENGVVRTPPGFAEAYGQVARGGWVSVAAPPEHGGMGLPVTLQTAVNDMMSAANLGLHTCILLSQGQIEAIAAHASDALRSVYLPRLISGEWSGTMNLTEPQAGSDVGALTTRAEPNGDGTYAITGRKIYITYGDSDLVDNVVHLVLARLPDAPAGTKGISLFLVPKRLPDESGAAGVANAVSVSGLEHKMGLHGSPTCTMEYDCATGWLVGEEGGGMAAMFTMMNNARLAVGVQGIGVAEGATQAALAWALERRQGRSPLPDGTGAIVDHADVRRMLAAMRAETFAARAIALSCAVAIDMETATGAPEWAARAALLTPIAKAWGTEVGHAVAQEAIQVHGGMGYVEETGVAQFARDVRVAAIYEGTNGIQAMDLVGRKLADGGEALFRLLDEIEAGAEAARGSLPALAAPVWQAAENLREATEWMIDQPLQERYAGAVPFLHATARVLGGHAHLAAALAGGEARRALAGVYIHRLLPAHDGLLAQARAGSEGLYALSPGDLAAA